MSRLWHLFYSLPDRAFRMPTLVLGAVLLLMLLLLDGCASFGYDWTQAHEPAPKPWQYITTERADAICRKSGAHVRDGERVLGCATWYPTGCVIVLPPNAPAWLREHEERHCNGEVHS